MLFCNFLLNPLLLVGRSVIISLKGRTVRAATFLFEHELFTFQLVDGEIPPTNLSVNFGYYLDLRGRREGGGKRELKEFNCQKYSENLKSFQQFQKEMAILNKYRMNFPRNLLSFELRTNLQGIPTIMILPWSALETFHLTASLMYGQIMLDTQPVLNIRIVVTAFVLCITGKWKKNVGV